MGNNQALKENKLLFEGSEKKVEICIDDQSDNLRARGDDYWRLIVSQSEAEIISKISNQQLDAYLLSESSLFVWKDRFTMITCGSTSLADAIVYFLKDQPTDKISSLIFQRKNEYFAHMQPSSFPQDAKKIHQQVHGKAFRFGDIDRHYNFLFHLDRPFSPPTNDTTSELLMYNIQGELAEMLREKNNTSENIREALEIETILPGFHIDDFAFKPFGYSLNAIKDQLYYTIHITPQMESSYVSFETNVDLASSNSNVLLQLVEKFSPGSFDIVSFNDHSAKNIPPSYHCSSKSKSDLSCGYSVSFYYYTKNKKHWLKPYQFSL